MAASSHAPPTFVPPTSLNITAISAQNGLSIFECWQILPGFSTSSQAGTVGASILQLGGLANMSYSVLPPNFTAGLHNAPTTQYVTSHASKKYTFTRIDTFGKMGCIFIGSRAHHPPQLHRRSFCPWRKGWLHLRGRHRSSKLTGPLDELPVRLRDHRTANPHGGYHSPAQCIILRSV